MRRTAWMAGCLMVAGCGGDDSGALVEKPDRPNPFPDYAGQIRYAKDWHRLSHHNRAIVVAHWAHAAGLTKAQSNALIWCLKARAEAEDAAVRSFADARRSCIADAKTSQAS